MRSPPATPPSNAGKSAPALWLVGFCLLVRRDVVERLGGLDEIFGQGNYEDTDYCLRAFLAGYRSVVAQDCFIHHVGSASFDAAGVDYATADRRQLRDLPAQMEPGR